MKSTLPQNLWQLFKPIKTRIKWHVTLKLIYFIIGWMVILILISTPQYCRYIYNRQLVIYSPDMETLVWRMLSRKEVVWVYKLVYIATVYRSPCPSQKSDPSCISMIGVSMFASIDLCIRLKTRVEHKCPRRVISFFFF